MKQTKLMLMMFFLMFILMFNPWRTTGIASAPYDESFRRRRRLYLSILKEFGFGQRLMENRINSEVSEFIRQARLTGGQAIDPSDMVHMCLTKVMASVLFGMRHPYGHPILKNIIKHVNGWFASVVLEIEYFRYLRFIPGFSGRFKRYVEVLKSFVNFIEQEVRTL